MPDMDVDSLRFKNACGAARIIVFVSALFSCVLALAPSSSEAANAIAAGTAEAMPAAKSIEVHAHYTGDDNRNSSVVVAWGTTDFSMGSQTLSGGVNPYACLITGLTNGTAYRVRVTYQDVDGISGTAVQTFTNVIPSDPLLHNSSNTRSAKWGGIWGVPGGKYGEFTCATCHLNGSVNIKNIRPSITAPNSPAENFPGSSIVFRDARDDSATNDFGDDSGHHANSTKICEACHSITKYHRYDSTAQTVFDHNNRKDCMKCHNHGKGFRASCNVCHGEPPVDNSSLVGFAYPSSTGSTTAGAHDTHVNKKGFSCEFCHSGSVGSGSTHNQGSVTLGFNVYGQTGGSYNGQTTVSYNATSGTSVSSGGLLRCGNIYCHSNASPLNGTNIFATPVWTGSNLGCNSCHSAPGDSVRTWSSSHDTHTRSYGFTCNNCHSLTASGNATIANSAYHVNNVKDVAIASQFGGAYTPATGCANVYCHGNYSGSGKNAAPVWTNAASAACGTCHGASNTAQPASGSHERHASMTNNLGNGVAGTTNRGYACTLCHAGIVGGSGPASYAIADRTKHASGKIDWGFDTSDARVSVASIYSIASGTQAPSDGTARTYGTCGNVYCHSIVQTATGGPLTGAPGEYYAPQWGARATCGLNCHPADGVHNPATIASGSHTKHLSYSYGSSSESFKCTICHKWNAGAAFGDCNQCHQSAGELEKHVNGRVDVLFDPAIGASGAYMDNTSTPGARGNGYFRCDNLYCHSTGVSVATGTVSANQSPVWGTAGPLACAACHAFPPNYANGSPKANSHAKHVTQAGLACVECHSGTVNSSGALISADLHVNRSYNVSGSKIGLFTFSSTGGTCSNVSCHSKVQADGGGALTGAAGEYSTPRWGGSVVCGDCHAVPPATGKHTVHLNGGGAVCGDCHEGAGNGATAPASGHANGTVNVGGGTTKIGSYSLTGIGDGYGTCANISCHGGNSAAWVASGQATTVNCIDCHGSTSDVDDFVYGNGVIAKINLSEWSTSGHGGIVTPLACATCHTTSVAHGSQSNYYRLADGVTTICNLCHSNLTQHFGDKHNSASGYVGGSLCWDCHDPHGDRDSGQTSPIKMIQRRPWLGHEAAGKPTRIADTDVAFSGNTAWGGYVASGPNYNGVCQICHESSSGISHFYRYSTYPTVAGGYDSSHNMGAKCTSCHTHNAFAPPPCNQCHGESGQIGAPLVAADMATTSGRPVGAHSKHVVDKGFACNTCHNGYSMPQTPPRMTISFSGLAQGGTYDGIAFTGTDAAWSYDPYRPTTTATQDCNNIYCHSSGQSASGGSSTPVYSTATWGDPTTGACGGCHKTIAGTRFGRIDTGSHTAHLNAGGIQCGNCHTGADGGTSYSSANHVNGQIDVANGYNLGGSPGNGYGSCSTAYCHGSVSPVWGTASSLGCGGCHGYPPITKHVGPNAVSHGFADSGARLMLQHDGCNWCHMVKDDGTGHQSATAPYTTAANHLNGKITLNSGLGYNSINRGCDNACHFNDAQHRFPASSGLPVELLAGPAATACDACHGYPPITKHAPGATPVNHAFSDGGAKILANHMDCQICHGTRNGGNNTHDPYTTYDVATMHRNGQITMNSTTQYNQTNFGCDNACHANDAAHRFTDSGLPVQPFAGQAGSCTGCHALSQGSRVAVMTQFGADSHHVQGVNVTNDKCHQCHWEANSDGSINSTYHGGASNPGAVVRLVIYGTGTRPTTYTVGTTAVEYLANGSRTEMTKINQVCLGCHSAKNSAAQPFGDGKTPKQYAWDGLSIDERYSQTGTTPWGKYTDSSTTDISPKNTQTKAYSAHGNASANQRGWNTSETWPNTSGTVSVICFDCHNSHGSTVTGKTSSYTSATASGAILKDITAGKGGFTITYKPQTGGSAAAKNAYNPGGALCFDCHNTQNAGTTPWGYQGTFGATQPIRGYFDTPYFGNTAYDGSQQRYPYKAGKGTSKGGHFGASASLATTVNGSINGICTPCHDPHGVSPSLGTNQQYGVPLLKGTWLTSPYKEDSAPSTTNVSVGGGKEGSGYNGASTPGYHIDQNTFANWSYTSTTSATQTDAQFGGLCLQCHTKAALSPDTNNTWKSVDRIHNSVKGWDYNTTGQKTQHRYTCSKCHTPHNSYLGRLLVTNCLDYPHRGQRASGGSAGSGNGSDGSGKFPAGGSGSGKEGSDSAFFGTQSCHDGTTAGGTSWPTNQRWNNVSPW